MSVSFLELCTEYVLLLLCTSYIRLPITISKRSAEPGAQKETSGNFFFQGDSASLEKCECTDSTLNARRSCDRPETFTSTFEE